MEKFHPGSEKCDQILQQQCACSGISAQSRQNLPIVVVLSHQLPLVQTVKSIKTVPVYVQYLLRRQHASNTGDVRPMYSNTSKGLWIFWQVESLWLQKTGSDSDYMV